MRDLHVRMRQEQAHQLAPGIAGRTEDGDPQMGPLTQHAAYSCIGCMNMSMGPRPGASPGATALRKGLGGHTILHALHWAESWAGGNGGRMRRLMVVITVVGLVGGAAWAVGA